jgi:hypothetical protein
VTTNRRYIPTAHLHHRLSTVTGSIFNEKGVISLSIFQINLELELLESQEKWCEAKDLLYITWIIDKNNLNSLLRIGTECWYVMSYWERLKTDGLNRNDFSGPLTEAKQYGEANFIMSDTFLWVYGYMIKLFPYWFDDFNGDLEDSEDKGKEMIKIANIINSQNKIAKMLILPDNSDKYKKACKDVEILLNEYFNGNSAIEQYFRGVWS